MGTTIMGAAAVSLDGFIADDNDEVGPLFDWLGGGEVSWSLPGSPDEARSTQASADFMTSHYANTAANVIGRRLFDLTNGWNGQPAAYEHVFVVTHQPPTDWEPRRHRAVHLRRWGRAGDRRRDGVRRRPGRRCRRGSDRQPGARARADRPSGHERRPGGLRLRPPVLRQRHPARAAAIGELEHDRARRPGHPPRLRRQPLSTERLIAEFAARPDPHQPPPELEELTEREHETLRLVAAGLSNDEIARQFVISPLTAKTHVSRILRKLGCRDRAQLVNLAYETRLVTAGHSPSDARNRLG